MAPPAPPDSRNLVSFLPGSLGIAAGEGDWCPAGYDALDLSAPGLGKIEADQVLQRAADTRLQPQRQLADRLAAGGGEAEVAVELADQAIGQADQRLAIELLGQQLLLESALLGDVLGGTENAHDQLAFVVPLRPARVAQPVAGAVPALDPILDARRLACEQPLSAPLHDAQIRGLDQGRPAAQGLDLGRAVAGQALEGACGPIENQAAIGLGAQMIDAIGGQIGERIEAALEPLRRGYDAALRGHVAQVKQVGPMVAGERATFDLEPDPAAGRAGDLQRQIDRALPLDRIDQPGDFLRLGSHRRQDVHALPDEGIRRPADQTGEAGIGIGDHGCRTVVVVRGHDRDRLTEQLHELGRQIRRRLIRQRQSANLRPSPLPAQT